MSALPAWNLIDVHAPLIRDIPFLPNVHLNDPEAVPRIKDGLPKMKDLPADMRSSAAMLAE